MAAIYEKINLEGKTREEWLELRKTGLGGSDIGTILGINPWRSPVEAYLDKIGEIAPQEENESMYWGNRLEDIVAEEFSERTEMMIYKEPAMYRHKKCPWMLANIDRWILCPDRGLGILEVKTAGEFMKSAWAADQVPDYYMLQLQHYFAVTGVTWGYFAVLIGGNKFEYKLVERDEELIDHLFKAEADFWKLVEDRTPPEMDGSDAAANLLKRLYPAEVAEDKEIDLMEDDSVLIDLYLSAKEDEDDAKRRKQSAENKLKDRLGHYQVGLYQDKRVEWKVVQTNKFDAKAFEKANPDMYREFCKPSSSRRFGVK